MLRSTQGQNTPEDSPQSKFVELFKDGKLPTDETLRKIVKDLSEDDLIDLASELAKEDLVAEGIRNRQQFKEFAQPNQQTRRGFLGLAISAGIAGFSLNSLVPRLLDEDLKSETPPKPTSEAPRGDRGNSSSLPSSSGGPTTANQDPGPTADGWLWKRPFFETLKGTTWETLLGYISVSSTNYLINGMGIPSGNTALISATLQNEPSREKLDDLLTKLEKDPSIPAQVFRQIGLKSPLIEEFLFRLAPAIVLRLDSSSNWHVGLPSAVVFAAFHMLVPTEKSQRGIPLPLIDKSLETTFLPLPQFMGGLVLWHINQRYGFIPAVAAHALHNFPTAVVTAGGIGSVPLAYKAKSEGNLAKLKTLKGSDS